MASRAEIQKAYRERKRAADEHREFEQFIQEYIIDTPFNSSITDEEKYAMFKNQREKAKVDERKRKRAKAAREKYKQDKLKREQQACEEQPEELIVEPLFYL